MCVQYLTHMAVPFRFALSVLREDGLFRFTIILAIVSVPCALYLLCGVRATGQRGKHAQMLAP